MPRKIQLVDFLFSPGLCTGPASLTGTVAITVHVADVNDHVPYFLDTDVQVNLPESSEVGSGVAVLMARDDDHGDGGQLTCQVVDGNQVTVYCATVCLFEGFVWSVGWFVGWFCLTVSL